MINFISSKKAQSILNVNRGQLNTLVQFGTLNPNRVRFNRFEYNLQEVQQLAIKKNDVKNMCLCSKS